jgi:signal transduction histidine kinase
MPLFIFHLGTEISLWSKVTTGSSLFYFPAPMAIILIYWWGPRILPAFYLNAALSAGLWGLDRIELWPVYALPETIFVFLSWLFFIQFAKGKSWLPDNRQTTYFLLLGIILPLFIYKFILEGLFVYAGDIPYSKFWVLLSTTSFGDFISTFGLTIPVFYFLTGPMARRQLANAPDSIPHRLSLLKNRLKVKGRIIELMLILTLLLTISRILVFSDYWFIYGVIALYVAIRWGFGTVVIINSIILLLTYLIPSILDAKFTASMIEDSEMLKIQLGSALLYVFSTITGRVISDVGVAEKRLSKKNEELEQTNKELDRFVYSVSHDLSSPLKSILGLVTISKIDSSSENKIIYLQKIEESVLKLESFINEILDYSHNKRLDFDLELIELQTLCIEILDNLKYADNFKNTKIDMAEIENVKIFSNRLRLKMILNNLLSNAIKFQQATNIEHTVRISARQKNDSLLITIEDNGQGIKPEYQPRIFDMFFRGTDRFKGSGLGLYIAKEAADKIGARLSVHSEYGKGSSFSLELKNVQA